MRTAFVLVALAAVIGGLSTAVKYTDHGEALAGYLLAKARGGYSLEERLSSWRAKLHEPMRQEFAAAHLLFPPEEISLLAFKDRRVIEVYGRSQPSSAWQFIKSVPVLGLSGQLGPKLHAGDLQVPEGFYRAEFLNPNGRFHVSIRLNYPNSFDRQQAQIEGRTNLGGDIMIHGTASSVGCLAVGNRSAEELFYLAGLVSKEKLRIIIISPTDFRSASMPTRQPGQPDWLPALYGKLQLELSAYPTHPTLR
ncbi:murein L,D-transpeptidase family protein [Leptothrix ochracea]|uniref:L,D-transpeptidase family protein n=1 Tax=Leptothrix ochracea TaxID=735331 RepID=UPI0034E2A370